ncbi:MAG: hypothetical protein U9Q66_00685 [Patescibacteria group bacterium]|nr:hypothetical protein [Patescibacteria group bacterium]
MSFNIVKSCSDSFGLTKLNQETYIVLLVLYFQFSNSISNLYSQLSFKLYSIFSIPLVDVVSDFSSNNFSSLVVL